MNTRIPHNALNPWPQQPRFLRPALGIPAPRAFSIAHTLWLATECCKLKLLLITQQTQITEFEERLREAHAQQGWDAAKIAALIASKRELTSALHRTACAG